MPIYSVQDLLSETSETLAAGRMNDYSLTEKDMRVALALFRRFKPTRVLDFGTNEGSTAAFLLEQCPDIELWVGVDLLPELFPARGIVPKVAGARARHDPRFHAVLTDETVEDFQQKLVAFLRAYNKPNTSILGFDCIIMDANHDDRATERDTDACSLFMHPGGLWLWHDYNVDSRQDPVGKPFGVKQYLDRREKDRAVMLPDEEDRNSWTCCSIAWEQAPSDYVGVK